MSTVISPDLAINPSVPIASGDYAKQLDLAPKSYAAPVYKYRRFNQISGGSNLTLSGANTLSQFNIPGGAVWNLRRSFLTFDLTSTAGAGADLNTIFMDNVPIDSIQLQTASGQLLVNLQNVQAYTKTARFLCTDLKEYLSRESCYVSNTVAASFGSINHCCQPAHCPIAAQTTTLETKANVVVNSQVIDAIAGTSPQTPSASPATAASGSDIDYIGPQRIGSGAAATATITRFKIDFDAFPGTILALDKDLYFGQNLQLNIYWKPVTNWGYSDVVAQTGTLVIPGLSMSNYYLYMANEVNPDHADDIMRQVNSGGLALIVPYTNCSQISTGAGSGNAGNSSVIFTMSTPLTPGMGTALKRIMTVPVNNVDSLELSANTFNVAQVKWYQIQTNLDGKPIQDQFLVDPNGDVWNYMYQMIKNTPAGMSTRNFHNNQFFVDNFSDCDDGSKFNDDDCKESGLTIDQSKTYNFAISVTTAPGLKLYQYQTWARKLIISPQGINWGM
jgi:hypothetical protein